jgi:hypothetical protein
LGRLNLLLLAKICSASALRPERLDALMAGKRLCGGGQVRQSNSKDAARIAQLSWRKSGWPILMLDRDGFLDPPRDLLQPFKMDQSPAVLRTAVSYVMTAWVKRARPGGGAP